MDYEVPAWVYLKYKLLFAQDHKIYHMHNK